MITRRIAMAMWVAAALAVWSAPAPVDAGEQWAVVVGVGAHDNAAIARAQYAVADAEAMYRVLVGPMAFKPDHVILLTDRTERKPTLRNVKWALGTFLARVSNRDDTIVIYFSGHGGVEADPRGLGLDALVRYLIARDTDPADLHSTGLPTDTFGTLFARLDADRIVVFLDASYSGAAIGRAFARRPGETPDETFRRRLASERGRVVVASSRPNEASIALPELGHGLFTYYLLEGLKGAADRNGDGMVTVQELYEHVEAQVTRKSREVGGNQHPVMQGQLEGAVPLIRLRRP